MIKKLAVTEYIVESMVWQQKRSPRKIFSHEGLLSNITQRIFMNCSELSELRVHLVHEITILRLIAKSRVGNEISKQLVKLELTTDYTPNQVDIIKEHEEKDVVSV